MCRCFYSCRYGFPYFFFFLLLPLLPSVNLLVAGTSCQTNIPGPNDPPDGACNIFQHVTQDFDRPRGGGRCAGGNHIKVNYQSQFPARPFGFSVAYVCFFFAVCCCSCHFHHFRGARYAIPTLWPDLSPAPSTSSSENITQGGRGRGWGTAQSIILIPAALAKFTSINGCNGKS